MTLFLLPAVIGAIGLWTGRNFLVVIALGLFVWLSLMRRQATRAAWSLKSVPPSDDGIKVSNFMPSGGDGGTIGQPTTEAPTCGCA